MNTEKQSKSDPSDSEPEPVRCCVTCGAVITEGTTAMHNRWHEQLAAAIVANRPDPRTAFIGG